MGPVHGCRDFFLKKEKRVRCGMAIQKAINLVGRVRQVETIDTRCGFVNSKETRGRELGIYKGETVCVFGLPWWLRW